MSQYGSYPNPQLCAKHGKHCETSGFSCKCKEIYTISIGEPTGQTLDMKPDDVIVMREGERIPVTVENGIITIETSL